ncbi:MAG: hypothetical protein NZ519_09690 [Bacteroidia bacterium]|nr:hypothetical protein [Bacteroidia bacterium]MDW8301914.1 hypothetical protein [Bacteroidia bacterium]
MNKESLLYADEPQYLWNVLEGQPISNNLFLPFHQIKCCEISGEFSVLDNLPKGRIWYHFNKEVFLDTFQNNAYHDIFFDKIQKSGFSVSLLTTSKGIMKYVYELQNIRNVEVGVYFSSDMARDNVFSQKLDTLRRLYYSEIYTIAYIDVQGKISDILNLAELVCSLCHTAYLYGTNIELVQSVEKTFQEHNKTVFIFAE